MTSPVTFPFLMGGLLVWSLYRRIRRNIGRQPLRPARITFSIVILALVTVLLGVAARQDLRLLLGMGGGLLLGVPLGFWGLRLTRFETTETGHSYTPNTHIGIALSALFAGRLLYRFLVLRDVASAPDHPPAMQSPLTFFIFGLTAGYYLTYYIGLFIHTHEKQ